jgi:hypothetical protein
MPWLIINEGEEDEIEIPIVEEGASRREVLIGGPYTRAFDGTLRSTVSVEKTEFELQTLPLIESDANAIKAMFENGTEFELGGDIVGSGNELTCKGTVTDSAFIVDGLLHKRQLRLLIQQV